jgi:spoIIIJ-associated protein
LEKEKHVTVDNELGQDNLTPDEAEPSEPSPSDAATPAVAQVAQEAAHETGREVEREDFVEDGRADTALDFVIDVLATMGMDCTVDLLENEPDDPPEEIRLEIEGKDAGRIIGKKGQTLTALQFLANRVINRPSRKRRHVVIDAEGYRARREDTLSSMARQLGQQAVAEDKIITFEPMNPQDRRIVHLALAKFPGVVTKSDGEGEARRVQIIPIRR